MAPALEPQETSSAEANTASPVSVLFKTPRARRSWFSREALLRVLGSTPFLGLVVAAFSWPVPGLDPSIGLDESWNAAGQPR